MRVDDLFYLPPQELWYLTVTRLSVTFDSTRAGTGTGFFVYDGSHYFIVTARHVVDPRYVPKTAMEQEVCTQMDISFQCSVRRGEDEPVVGYQKMRVTEPAFLYDDGGTDVAVIQIPAEALPIRSGDDTIRPCAFSLDYLASDEDLSSRYAGEPVVFVGFPDNAPINRVGASEFHYPVLRQGVFAFPPVRGIDVEGQLGSDYGLIDSYAQSGFSGGPVICLQKGWADGSWHPKEDYRAPKLVGLVCGHYRSRQDRADGGHAGLSFFARATSIRAVIAELQAREGHRHNQ